MADLYDERVVTEAEGLELAKEYDCVCYSLIVISTIHL
jgi:hypothetical protein